MGYPYDRPGVGGGNVQLTGSELLLPGPVIHMYVCTHAGVYVCVSVHLPMHVCRKVKKPDPKDYTLYDFVYVKFSERQNFGGREATAGGQDRN